MSRPYGQQRMWTWNGSMWKPTRGIHRDVACERCAKQTDDMYRWHGLVLCDGCRPADGQEEG